MKPTTAKPGENSINQIPGTFTIEGDVRLLPTYKMADMKAKLNQYLADFQRYVAAAETWHLSYFARVATRVSTELATCACQEPAAHAGAYNDNNNNNMALLFISSAAT
jgi:acetylornithine deacetylase/succinyl-diaminopimelate desuccinylase-like protein